MNFPILEMAATVIAGVIVTLASGLCGILYHRCKQAVKERDLAKSKASMEDSVIREGIKALLHDRLYTAHLQYMKQGFCSMKDKQNLTYIYAPYEKLGGNGTGKLAYDDIMNLPIEVKSKEELKR